MDLLGPPDDVEYIQAKVSFFFSSEGHCSEWSDTTGNGQWHSETRMEISFTYKSEALILCNQKIPVMEMTVHRHTFTKGLKVL